jgi:hypothetical protein
MFRFIKSLTRKARRPFRKPSYRLQVEALEDRLALTTLIGGVTATSPLLNVGTDAAITSYAKVGFFNNEVGTLAAYLDNGNGPLDTNPKDFTVKINWDDGTGWQPGQIALNASPAERIPFLIKGSHNYTSAGDYHIEVMVTGDGATTEPVGTCLAVVQNMPSPAGVYYGDHDLNYAPAPPSYPGMPFANLGGPKPLGAVGLNIVSVDKLPNVDVGQQVQATVAEAYGFYNAIADTNPNDYQVQINWGDSSSWQIGQVVSRGNDRVSFNLEGSHTYYTPGTYDIVVTFTGPDGQTLSADTTSVNVVPGPSVVVGPVSPAQWDANQPGYDGTIPVWGGSNAYQNLSVSGLPSGLAASLSGNAISISGTPTQAGTFSLDVSLQDTNGNPGNAIDTLTINPALALGPLSPAAWTVNKAGYDGTISITGGTDSYSGLEVSGLPAGLTDSLSGSTITIYGKPTQSGSFSLNVSVQDSNGNTVSGTDPLTINSALALGPLSPTTWTAYKEGYNGTIAITGGTGSYSGLQVSGLPAGLTDSISGSTITISGTPTKSGSFPLTVSVQDSIGDKASGTDRLQIAVPKLTLTPATLPSETAGQAYSQTLTATGGSGQYSFALLYGSLPGGLSLSRTGVLSGTATKAGTYTFTVRAADTQMAAAVGSQSYTLTVNPGAAASITVSAPSKATAGTGFSVTITAKDMYGNGVNGPVSLSSSDGQPVTHATVTLTKGTGKATVTLTYPDGVGLVAKSGTASGTSGTITVDAPAWTPATMQFQLEASIDADPTDQAGAVNLFQSLQAFASADPTTQYQVTATVFDNAMQGLKNALDQALPAPPAGTKDPTAFALDLVHGAADGTIDLLKLAGQAVLFDAQPPSTQMAVALDKANLTLGAAAAITQYVADNPQQAATDVIQWMDSTIKAAQARPGYTLGNLVPNIALAAATGGTGEAASFAPIAGTLEQLAAKEGLAAVSLGSRTTAAALQGAADQLVADVAGQSARQALNQQILANYVKGLPGQLKPLLNAANGTNNCALVTAETIYYYRGGLSLAQSAPAVGELLPGAYLEAAFDTTFPGYASVAEGDAALAASSTNGDYGAIAFEWAETPGNQVGHSMSWLNFNGTIYYIDAQNGAMFTADTLAATYGQVQPYAANLTQAPLVLLGK